MQLLINTISIISLYLPSLFIIIFYCNEACLIVSLLRFSIVQAKTITWKRESHRLFDYQSKDVNQNRFKIDKTTAFFAQREQFNVEIRTDKQIGFDIEDNTKLLEIDKIKGKAEEEQYWIRGRQHNNQEQIFNDNEKDENIYIVVRALKSQNERFKGYTLQLGDIIKLGRVKLIVSQIKTPTEISCLKSHSFLNSSSQEHEVLRSYSGICKICLSDQQSQHNFLIAPCNCRGSCQLVHLLCLRQWIKSKILTTKSNDVTSISYEKLKCQISQDSLPITVKKNGITYDMLNIQKPKKSYIVLQSLESDDTAKEKTVHIISEVENLRSIKIGRAGTCQVKTGDISVSRVHAKIFYENGKFVLYDSSSKFGTLVMLNKPMQINPLKIVLQIGSTIIGCALKKKQAGETIEAIEETNQYVDFLPTQEE